ncbi:lysylphosphatidylglycerol synthase transmembrane domain-containing protein [Thermoleophilum album]|uniref:Uncharacterized membrane protein YbhN, UPF0104 family n=1 Tax=Thermoleophilum album TaxID=29539 RepID=A0A1H6FJQ8_THEAL|nr:lysylphosphatidylglycerol synthase transmembrane domain-containing protein [Thermoleophilum album]SEH10632.1 Uncharacterized membrane protein YbhN, UPF0104 family [Thermoleophilum album]
MARAEAVRGRGHCWLAAPAVGWLPAAALGDSFRAFFDALDQFFARLASVDLVDLLVALVAFTIYLTLRARASYNILGYAYPQAPIRFRRVWGAYIAGYGFNAVFPARGGDVVRLFLTRIAVPGATYPAVASSFLVEAVFDVTVGLLVLLFAFSQGVFPRPPDFARLNAFDLSWLASHPREALLLLTVLLIAVFVVIAVLSARVAHFWGEIRRGLSILRDRRAFLRRVYAVQALGWLFRCAAFWFLLEAFGIGGSVRNVLLVLGVNAVSAAVPFTPQGAGVQQALLVTVFKDTASAPVVTAYSVGQQLAVATLTFVLGLFAVVRIFRFRSFRDVVEQGRADRARGEPAPTTSTRGDEPGPAPFVG